MVLLWRFGNVRVVFLLIAVQWFMYTHAELSICSKSKEGSQTLYRKVSGDDGVLICIKKSGRYVWKFLDGSSTLGEKFNPAKDCSDIVDNLPGAKDGFYWIKHNKGNLCKGWCDTHTDSGGFLLIGMNNSPVTWNVPSNDTPVNPVGLPHWSSKFGDVNVQDFAIQISTTKNFEDTMAHWSYRLKINPALGNLFGVGSGGCTDIHSGIGNVSYVKDILTGAVVTTNFNCSKFGPHQDFHLGWGRMNYCLRNKCPLGYAFFKGVPLKLDNHGSFSYSASSEFSGVTHDATAFFGCDAGKCCACFGPKGGRGHYCSKKCQAVNGGTVLTGKVYIWYWIRTRMPKKVWKRCMEFKMKSAAGKFETYYIDRNTGITHKGTCSEHFQTFFNEGTLLVKNKESFNNLIAVPGLLSYREDNGNRWDEISSKKEQDAQFKTLEKNMTAMLGSLEDNLETTERKLNAQNTTNSTMMPTTSTTNTTMMPTTSTTNTNMMPTTSTSTTNTTMMPTTSTTNTTMMPTTNTTNTTMMPTTSTSTTNTTMMPTTNTTNRTMMPTTSTTNITMMPTTNTTTMATTILPTNSTPQPTTIANTTLIPVGCQGNLQANSYCKYWKGLGYCQNTHVVYMVINCCQTCNDGCVANVQSDSNCQYWAALGYCQTTYVAYVEANCCQTCKNAKCTDKDTRGYCPEWKTYGFCAVGNQYFQSMRENCTKTCDECL